MHSVIAEIRPNRALSAYASLLFDSCSAALTKFLRSVASPYTFSSLHEQKDLWLMHCSLRQHTSKAGSSVVNLTTITLKMGHQKKPAQAACSDCTEL